MSEKTIDYSALQAVVDALTVRFGKSLLDYNFEKGELAVHVGREILLDAVTFLNKEQGFNALNDIIGLDNQRTPVEGKPRFSVLYQLYKFPDCVRVRLVVDVAEDQPLPSITAVFKAADWAEREIFDMFGLRFEGHPGLTRIYMADDFTGFPLRKDFPLAGE